MKTSQRAKLPRKTKPTAVDSVKFHDGMIVTAEDLAAAQQYPASLLRTVLRAYFGCGVVCGLNLRVKQQPGVKARWILCVEAGVAIDCAGNPIELCRPAELDLSPEACACEEPPAKVYILIRRVTSDEPSRDPCSGSCSCSCSCSADVGAAQFDCRRTREEVLIQAFSEDELNALRTKVCRRTADAGGDSDGEDGDPGGEKGDPGGESKVPSLCAPWITCSACGCAESWILLGSVALGEDGIDGDPDAGERPWVNPVEVFCRTLERRITDLENRAGAMAPSPAAPAPVTPTTAAESSTAQSPAAPAPATSAPATPAPAAESSTAQSPVTPAPATPVPPGPSTS
jgi:hypothetical protein